VRHVLAKHVHAGSITLTRSTGQVFSDGRGTNNGPVLNGGWMQSTRCRIRANVKSHHSASSSGKDTDCNPVKRSSILRLASERRATCNASSVPIRRRIRRPVVRSPSAFSLARIARGDSGSGFAVT